MALTVRHANIEDAEQIARVHVTAWQAAYVNLISSDYLDGLDIGERTEHWRSILSGELTVSGLPRPADFVVETDGEVVGFANVGRFRDEPQNKTAGELWAMYVDPLCWGIGAGDALMAATLEELRRLGTTSAYLWVLEGNERAIRFYERHGWRSDGQGKSFDLNGVEIPEVRYSLKR